MAEEARPMRLRADSRAQLETALLALATADRCCGPAELDAAGECAYAMLTPSEVDTLCKTHHVVATELLDADADAAVEPRATSAARAGAAAPFQHLSVEAIEDGLAGLAQDFPDVTEQLPMPQATHEGRRSSALRVGASVSGAPAMIVLGGVHPREWVPPDLCMQLAGNLLSAHRDGTGLTYGEKAFTPAEIGRVVESLDLVVFPCVNPDGRAHTQAPNGDRMWRGNRHLLGDADDPNCHGVDINRNFPFLWDYERAFAPSTHGDIGIAKHPCGDPRYRGPAPGSEAETLNVMHLLDEFQTRRRTLAWFVDVHCNGMSIIHRWNHALSQSVDNATNFANPQFDGQRGLPSYEEFLPADEALAMQILGPAMRDGCIAAHQRRHEVIAGIEMNGHPVVGLSDDYAYTRHRLDGSLPRVLTFTLELGNRLDGFQPTPDRARRMIDEGAAGLVGFALAALDAGPMRHAV